MFLPVVLQHINSSEILQLIVQYLNFWEVGGKMFLDPYVSEVINNIGYAADGGIIAEEWSTLSESNRKRYGYEHYAMVNFGVTQNNYLHLKAGDIFDGNGHTILVNHDICYNEVTGKYDRPLGEIGLTYNGGYIHPLNYAMSGLFRVEEFYADGNLRS